MAGPEWSDYAREDLLAIVDYIADDNPQAAQALLEEIDRKVANLALHPQLYRKGRIANTREMVVRNNYLVVYQDNDETVRILRVLHAAQQWPPHK